MSELPSMMALHGATLVANSYSVIPIQPGVKKPGRFATGEWQDYADWSRHCDRPTKLFEIDIWRRWPGCAVGIACGRVCAIDIDILDGALAHRIQALAFEMLGETPALRIGMAPKRMLIYRTDTPFAGRKRHPLEVLCRGQQFLAYAIHPVTQRPYEWPDESLIEMDISRLPIVTEAKALAWLDAAYALVPPEMRPQSTLIGDSPRESEWKGPSDPKGTYDAVRSALAFIPNEDVDGASWVQMGNAIKAALGEEGRDLWLEWSKSSNKSGASGKTDTAEKRWAGFRPHSIGAGTIYYLAEQRGWIPGAELVLNGAVAELSDAPNPAAELIAKLAAQPAPPATTAMPGPAPAIMDVDGALRLFIDYTLATSISPQPFLALGAGLCLMGALAGRRYRTPTDLRSNLYAVGIADSGGGKDHARVIAKKLLYEAGLDRYLGGEEIASGQGLLTSLKRHPARLYLIDEMGKFLATTNSKKAPGHKMEVWTNLTKLYTSANSIYLGTEYADQDTRPRVDIQQPCAGLWGVTVPNTFWSALENGAMSDGSLARFLIFLSPEDYPDRNEAPVLGKPPADLIAAVKAIATGRPGHDYGGNLGATMQATADIDPYTVPYSTDARALLRALQADQTEWLRQVRGTPATALVARLWENVAKLALVRAVSRDPAKPEIDAEAVRWATQLGEHCVRTMLREADRYLADNEVEAKHKKVLALIRKAGKVSKNEIVRQTQFLQRRERDEILAALAESGLVTTMQVHTEGANKPTTYFVASATSAKTQDKLN